MTDVERINADGTPWYPTKLGPIPTYDGYCCRVWPLAIGFPVGRCGICGQRPRPMAEKVIA